MNHTVRFVFANIARLLGAVFVAVAGLCFVTAIAAQSSAVNASVPNGTASNEGLRLVAQKNVSLANENLARSRDRFTSGVTDSVEVVQSEQSLASANDQHIMSVYNHNLAELMLARSLGVVHQLQAAHWR